MARTSTRARRTSHLYVPSAFELFQPSKKIILDNIWIFGPLYAIPFIFWVHSWVWAPLPNHPVHWWQRSDGFSSGWPGGPLPTYLTFAAVGFSVLWLAVTVAAGTIVQIMSQAAQLEGARRRKFDFPSLWAAVRELGWRMLGLYVVTSIVVFVGFVLLIIPGLFMIKRYLLAPYVMLDEKLGIRESMDKSAVLSRVNGDAVWGLIGVLFLIGLLNILPIVGGLMSFAVGGLYSAAPALRYRQLKKLAER